jgi:hypothetical protein
MSTFLDMTFTAARRARIVLLLEGGHWLRELKDDWQGKYTA